MLVTQFSNLRVTEASVLVHVETGEDIASRLREGGLHHEDNARRGARDKAKPGSCTEESKLSCAKAGTGGIRKKYLEASKVRKDYAEVERNDEKKEGA
jgi:hypothetical protein